MDFLINIKNRYFKPKPKADMMIKAVKSKAFKGSIIIAINRHTYYVTNKLSLTDVKREPLSVLRYLETREHFKFPSEPNSIIQINKQFFAVKDLLHSAE